MDTRTLATIADKMHLRKVLNAWGGWAGYTV